MCLIIYKPTGAEMPPKDHIKNGWENNSHGAGIMYFKDGKVVIEKGFMKRKHLERRLKSFSINDEIAVHFRTGTSGGRTPENTHPFPITSKPDLIKALYAEHYAAIMHNGIIGTGEKEFSDTAVFIKDHISALDGLYHAPAFSKIISLCLNYTGNRFLTFYHNGTPHAVMTGKWEKVGDIYYSNTDYEDKFDFNYINTGRGLPAYNWKSSGNKHTYSPSEVEDYFSDDEICPECRGLDIVGDTDEPGKLLCIDCGISWNEAIETVSDCDNCLHTSCWGCEKFNEAHNSY